MYYISLFYFSITDALLADLQTTVSSPQQNLSSRSSGYGSNVNGASPLAKQRETFDYDVERTVSKSVMLRKTEEYFLVT